MIVSHFILTSLETGVMAGHALLCPEARYATARWRDLGRLDRRFVSTSGWKVIEAESRDGWHYGAVPPEATVSLALVPDGYRHNRAGSSNQRPAATDSPRARLGVSNPVRSDPRQFKAGYLPHDVAAWIGRGLKRPHPHNGNGLQGRADESDSVTVIILLHRDSPARPSSSARFQTDLRGRSVAWASHAASWVRRRAIAGRVTEIAFPALALTDAATGFPRATRHCRLRRGLSRRFEAIRSSPRCFYRTMFTLSSIETQRTKLVADVSSSVSDRALDILAFDPDVGYSTRLEQFVDVGVAARMQVQSTPPLSSALIAQRVRRTQNSKL